MKPDRIAALAVLSLVSSSLLGDGFHSTFMTYKDPYEYWIKNKKDLGFDTEAEESYQKDPDVRAARIKELEKEVTALEEQAKKATGQARVDLYRQMNQLRQELYRIRRGPQTPAYQEQRRKTFINELVKGMAFVNDVNVRPAEFPEFTRDYDGALTGIGKIFREIGEPAVPYLWDAIVQELRFAGPQGLQDRKELEHRKLQVDDRIKILSAELRKKLTQENRSKINQEYQTLSAESQQLAEQLGMGNGMDENLKRNRDFISKLTEILMDIGPAGAPHIAADLGHSSPEVVRASAIILRKMGKPAVPAIVLQLTIKGRELPAARLLQAMSGNWLGTDVEAWKDCFRKKGVRFPGDPATTDSKPKTGQPTEIPGDEPSSKKPEPVDTQKNLLDKLAGKGDPEDKPGKKAELQGKQAKPRLEDEDEEATSDPNTKNEKAPKHPSKPNDHDNTKSDHGSGLDDDLIIAPRE